MTKRQTIRIGGASGYWGESAMSTPQLLAAGGLDFIVYDYLAEITMSIMARARAADPEKGYATDFVSAVMKRNLPDIARQGVRIVANAGGVNPDACAAAVRELIDEAGLSLSVAVVKGDDLTGRAADFAEAGTLEMFSGAPFPDPGKVASVNAYIGAFPIAQALDAGADIVIVGRCVDSAVTLGACIHAFGWSLDDRDALAGGSLAGHILECGPQATGGNFTDWEDVAGGIADIGYPIAEIATDGSFTTTKPEGTGGMVTVGTVGEQLLYEIGDPQAYLLPDVVCDFSGVTLRQDGPDRVAVAGARGRPAPDHYKVCATYMDGYRAGDVLFFYGEDAARKARAFADAAVSRARRALRDSNAADFDETLVEIHGEETHYGAYRQVTGSREVTLKLAVKHRDQRAAGMFLKETMGLGLATPPGLSIYGGGRPKPMPVVRLFSFLLPKSEVPLAIATEDGETAIGPDTGAPVDLSDIQRPEPPKPPAGAGELAEVPLIRLAFGRSGDKGDKANIGILARDPEYLPWIWQALTEEVVADRFAHFLRGEVERFYLPGPGAINFLLHDVLGGGGIASLRNDPQGKGYAQILLQTPVPIPVKLAETLR